MASIGRTLASALVLASAGLLAACTTAPLGHAPNLKGTYYENALVTNPNGGGPQVIIWGPPSNYNPDQPN